MSARSLHALRSHPLRAGAFGLAVILALGTAVAILGGAGSGPGLRDTGASSVAVDQTTPTTAGSPMPVSEALSKSAGGGTAPAAASASAPELGYDSSNSSVAAPVPPMSPPGPDGLGGPPLPQAVAAGNSRIVKTAALTVGVDKGHLGGGQQQVLDALAAAGGWVQSSQIDKDQASFVLKVPSDKLETVVSSLRRLGKVRSESMAGEDVTASYVDLEARLTHWRAQESVFLGLMAKAKTISETVQIQQQLSQIQQQIEQLEGQRRYLEGQTTYSTVRLTMLEDGAVAKEPKGEASPAMLARAWDRAVGAALAVLGGTLVVLGALVPLAAVIGVPALLVLAVRRRRHGPGAPAPALPAQG